MGQRHECSWTAPLGRLGCLTSRDPSRPGAPFPFRGSTQCPFEGYVDGGACFLQPHFTMKTGQSGARAGGPAQEGLRPLLPWSRRGGVPPRACLLVRGWQKFKLVKSGLVPLGEEKRLGPPSPSRAWRRLAQQRGRLRPPLARRGPAPGAAPRPLPGRRGAPSSMKGIPLLSLAWVWTPLPRGRRGAEDGAQTWDPHHHR